MPERRKPETWWLIGNNQFGVHVAPGRTGVEAKRDVRERITETYLGEGLSRTDARRAASSYGVFVIAGRLDAGEAQAARRDWDLGDSGPVFALARRYGSRFARRTDLSAPD